MKSEAETRFIPVAPVDQRQRMLRISRSGTKLWKEFPDLIPPRDGNAGARADSHLPDARRVRHEIASGKPNTSLPAMAVMMPLPQRLRSARESGRGKRLAVGIEHHKIRIDQCVATEDIHESFGLENALDYLIGEKLFTFLMASEQDAQFAAEVPAFVDEIRRIFTTAEIREYLRHLERTRFLAPSDPVPNIDDPDDEIEDEPWPENPVSPA